MTEHNYYDRRKIVIQKSSYKTLILIFFTIVVFIAGFLSTQSRAEELEIDKIDRQTSQTGIVIDDIAFGIHPNGMWLNDNIENNLIYDNSGKKSEIVRQQTWKKKIKDADSINSDFNNPIFSEFLSDFCRKNNSIVNKVENNNYYSIINDGDNIIRVELKYYTNKEKTYEYITVKYIKPINL